MRPTDIVQVKHEIQIGKLAVEYKNGNVLLINKQSEETVCIATLTPPNEWVSVKDRLPERGQNVLMLFKSGNMAVGWLYDVDEHTTFWIVYTDDGFYTDRDNVPLYWLSLPQLPIDFHPKKKIN